jgi:D-glycero-alpha-D-manno-heptose-7-phosphate kinase
MLRSRRITGYRYQARVPLVVDLAGFFSDLPVFAEADAAGGAVLSFAISLYARGSIVRSGGADRADWHAIIGGHHSGVEYQLDAPLAQGLGASAAQTALWLSLVQATVGNTNERVQIAAKAYAIEQSLGIISGPAQHYASAVGAFTLARYSAEVQVEQFRPPLSVLDELEPRLLLVESGQHRSSSQVVQAVIDSYQEGPEPVSATLRSLAGLAHDGHGALMSGDLTKLAAIVDACGRETASLHPSIVSQRLAELMDIGRAAGAAVKPVGAGGGGCVLFVVQPDRREALATRLKAVGAQPIRFEFDWYGVHLTKK